MKKVFYETEQGVTITKMRVTPRLKGQPDEKEINELLNDLSENERKRNRELSLVELLQKNVITEQDFLIHYENI